MDSNLSIPAHRHSWIGHAETPGAADIAVHGKAQASRASSESPGGLPQA
jgi:hypothetical protein